MQKVLRWIGIVLGALVALVVIAAIFVYVRSNMILNKQYTAPEDKITIPTDAAAIERGRYLANYVSVCVDCHGAKLEGGLVADDPMLGRITAPNLTKGKNGVGGQLSDADFVRVLRYGVMPDGKSARVMPANDYTHWSDADLGAIIAYVKSVPPADSDFPSSEVRPFGRTLMALGQLPIMIAERVDRNTSRTAPAAGVTVDYGHYLANGAGCTGCHGPGLSGGPIPGGPPDWPQAANLTPSGEVGKWSEADFINTIRTGVNPAGKTLDKVMPWFRYREMTDNDLKTVWQFVKVAPAKPFGNR